MSAQKKQASGPASESVANQPVETSASNGLEELALASPKVLASTDEFVHAAREVFSLKRRSGSWMQPANISDKFFYIKRELGASGYESALYSDSRIVGMFYSKQFFPKSWTKLDPVERVQAITRGLKEIEPDMRAYLLAQSGESRRRRGIKSTDSCKLEDTPTSPPRLKRELVPCAEPTQGAAPITPPDSLTQKSSLSESPVASSNPPITPQLADRIKPFSFDILTTQLSSLTLPVPGNHWPTSIARPSTILDLLNAPADTLGKWLHKNGISMAAFKQRMSRTHPALSLLFAELEYLGLSHAVANTLRKHSVLQSKWTDGKIVPDCLAPMRPIDNGFRLLTSPEKPLLAIPAEQRARIRQAFLNHGFSGKQGS
jgi:hypothetical protein